MKDYKGLFSGIRVNNFDAFEITILRRYERIIMVVIFLDSADMRELPEVTPKSGAKEGPVANFRR